MALYPGNQTEVPSLSVSSSLKFHCCVRLFRTQLLYNFPLIRRETFLLVSRVASCLCTNKRLNSLWTCYYSSYVQIFITVFCLEQMKLIKVLVLGFATAKKHFCRDSGKKLVKTDKNQCRPYSHCLLCFILVFMKYGIPVLNYYGFWDSLIVMYVPVDLLRYNDNKNSSRDEIGNVNFLRRYRTHKRQSLRPLNRVPNFYDN